MEQNTLMTEYADTTMEIDLREVLCLLWKHLVLIIEAGLCAGAVVFLFCTLTVSKTYVSTTEVYILQQQSDRNTVTASDLQTGSYLTNDYRELITSLPVLEKVIAQLDLDLRPEEFERMITVTTPDDTRIIRIAVEDTDPYRAHLIADTLREAASAQIAQVMAIEAVKVVQPANYPDTKAGPARMKMTVIGCVAGVLLAVGALILWQLFDDTIKNAEDIEMSLGLFVLGSVPELKDEGRRYRKGSRR